MLHLKLIISLSFSFLLFIDCFISAKMRILSFILSRKGRFSALERAWSQKNFLGASPPNPKFLFASLACPPHIFAAGAAPVYAYVRSDVQSSRLPQFYLVNPGFQLIWIKISLPHTSKFICTLCRSPNSTNHELLFDHLSKTIDTITLQSPSSEITVLGVLNVYNPNWLTHSPHITSPAGRDAEAFAICKWPVTIDIRTFTSNLDIYSNPILDSPLGNSGHCIITLQHNFASHQDRSYSSQKVLHYSKAEWDFHRNFFADYPWYSGLSNDVSSFATFITIAIQLSMDLFIPSSYKPGKKSSPKWFNSQCAKAVKHKNHRFR